ncbi:MULTISPECIES: NAD-dependent epimerase/dehydratase family protein [unclassified Mucilaginibacter]|uniref:NAD-dependent epimerase/dehydratase family protein n=1 Tax=unclassified Mucilaginibacter TaxID=2617802 RepID=UPI002AC8EB22|nr:MULTISPECIES: NAD-dependent epimerase/dehydratase family protein [unclassified Mucilaginibacter]MEB0248831.1 NAD-dependent epimerase/dehydratase family protein [Mucilaginibacter sp. 5B2]MEB0278744.1 NAD-dependent epimerase/dehydratase family protein [Mucilaginibacter sp. 10B2]MEB0301722.1 NAD-dependent epimerase/dehydratase family protein [Mucilaginibacter sp. 5C4]WPX23304.1 NAD-dependent epimerase/dehydratase family protein [Mucilaginibacter sp. 5C4]
MSEKILVIGANGQIGTELVTALRSIHGAENIIASDINSPNYALRNTGPFEFANVLDKDNLHHLFEKHQPTQVYLLAAILSAVGEQKPKMAWDLNMTGLLYVLDFAVEFKTSKIFWPSSIAVFGPHSPQHNTPQYCVMDPNTVYGFSKLAGERWCEYYFTKYGVDVRSIRYPGLIGWRANPGGGTTDYAVHIFHEALKTGKYQGFLSSQTGLPMMYMDDAIRATINLMDAPAENLSIRSSYNLAGISFTPEQLAEEIKKHIPEFEMSYADKDPRQAIADSWPKSIDDTQAQQDWGWQLDYDLAKITEDMLTNLKKII